MYVVCDSLPGFSFVGLPGYAGTCLRTRSSAGASVPREESWYSSSWWIGGGWGKRGWGCPIDARAFHARARLMGLTAVAATHTQQPPRGVGFESQELLGRCCWKHEAMMSSPLLQDYASVHAYPPSCTFRLNKISRETVR